MDPKEKTVKKILLSCGAADAGACPYENGSMIAAVFPYYVPEEKGELSLYARGPDYHKVVLDVLKRACAALSELYPDNSFEPFCDVSPYNEVLIAASCGLGVLGMNRLLITEKYGSWVFLGVIRTDLVIDARHEIKKCLMCGRCRSACPGGALDDGFDVEKCLSYITQTRRELTKPQKELLSDAEFIWGCDICQNVCPMNENVARTDMSEFLENRTPYLPDGALELSDREIRRTYADRAFSWRGIKPLKRNREIQKK